MPVFAKILSFCLAINVGAQLITSDTTTHVFCSVSFVQAATYLGIKINLFSFANNLFTDSCHACTKRAEFFPEVKVFWSKHWHSSH